jgi:hypothetical protein
MAANSAAGGEIPSLKNTMAMRVPCDDYTTISLRPGQRRSDVCELRLSPSSKASSSLTTVTTVVLDHRSRPKDLLIPLATAFHGICIDDDTYSILIAYDISATKFRQRFFSDYRFSRMRCDGLRLAVCNPRKSAKHLRTKIITTFFSSSHFRSRSAPAILAI